MTPQEKYPKFYLYPHHWIDAIEVRVNKSFEMDGYHFREGLQYGLDLPHLNELVEHNRLTYVDPKFKPQEGEAFIKDLESAVSLAIQVPVKEHSKAKDVWILSFEDNDGIVTVIIPKANLEQFAVSFTGSPIPVLVDTAAYVDKLRQLGYYV